MNGIDGIDEDLGDMLLKEDVDAFESASSSWPDPTVEYVKELVTEAQLIDCEE